MTTDPKQLLQFIPKLFPYFPHLTRLIINTVSDFMLFNPLTEHLHRYCPLLETLHILKTAEGLKNSEGLKNILEKYPYLSDLKIVLCPRTGTQGTNDQFKI